MGTNETMAMTLSPSFRTGRNLCLILAILFGLTSCAPARNLLALFSSPSQRYIQEGDRLAAEDRQSEALLAYRQAVNLDGKNVAALQKLAAAYSRQGRLRTARRYLKIALALDPNNGEIRQDLAASTLINSPGAPMHLAWQVELGEASPSGIALSDEGIYAAMEDGAIYALARASGKIQWQVNLPAAATSAPVAAGGLVFIGAQDGRLYALASGDGRQIWSAATSAPIFAAPLASGGRVFCPSSDGSLSAFNQADGALLWKFPVAGALYSQPALLDGVLYFGSSNAHLYAVIASDGSAFWPAGIPTQGPIQSPPLVSAGRVFFGSDDGRFYALAAASGGEYWRYSTSDAIYAAPAFYQDTVIAASSDGTIVALDLLSGVPRWEILAAAAVTQAPLVVDTFARPTLLYITSTQPWLYAVDLQTGNAIWRLDTGDWLSSTPLAAQDGMVYLAGKDGTILAYAPVSK